MQNKKIVISSLIVILLFIIIRVFLSPLVAGDEFINYYNTFKIFNGERMWEEVNIITTPFIYLLGMLFFKILGTNFIVYKIYNLIVNIIFFAVLYKTFRNLQISKISSLIYTAILEIPIISYVVPYGVTYNIISIILVLLGLNLTLKRSNLKRYNLWQGLMILLILFTKHNIGLYYAVSQIIIELIIEEKSKKITNLVKQFCIVAIGIIGFFAVLYYKKLLNSFIDMAILGLSSFTSNFEINIITLLVTFGSIVLLTILICNKKYKNKENVIILSTTGIMMLFIAFPIADSWHMILASIVLYIELIYMLHFNEIKLENNKILLGIDIYLILFVVLNITYTVFGINNNHIKFETNSKSKFYLSFIKDYQSINKVEEYITNKKVLIISPEAGIYNLNLNLESHGFFDEPFSGNIGTNQLEKMCNKLEEYKDYYILIHTDKKYIQEVDEFRNYIIQNYSEIEKVEDYTVYKR